MIFSPFANFGNQSLHSLSTLVTIIISTHLKQRTYLRFIFVVFSCQIQISSYFGFEILDIIRAINFENQTVESKQIFGSTWLLHTTKFVLVYNCPAGLVKWSSQLPTPDSLARCILHSILTCQIKGQCLSLLVDNLISSWGFKTHFIYLCGRDHP